jgi:MFS family permease
MDYILKKVTRHFKDNRLLGAVYTSNILLSFHYYLIVYINSSFLSGYFSPAQISVLYIIGSIINLVLFINISKILKHFGNYKLIKYTIIAEILAVFGLAFAVVPFLLAVYFIIYQVCTPTISFGLDILLESVSVDEEKTGDIRGTYLTFGNITLVMAPIVVAFILIGTDYYRVYLVSLIFIIALYFTIKKYFRKFNDGETQQLKIRETIQDYLKNKDLSNVFTAHFLLQVFYSYMVIYTPVYLYHYIGFSWEEIGIMFTIMLLPFALFELPIGRLGDRKYGEKEMMTIGFVLLGLFTLWMSFVTTKNFALWTFILFMTRTGAAMVEITTDSYFFKKVNQNNANVIGIYRMGNPLSFIVAPILATLSLQFLPYGYIFIVLGFLMIFGCHYSLALHDTK